MKQYDVIIIGAGPGGIFSAYELSKLCPEKRIAVFEEGQPLEKRRCPIDAASKGFIDSVIEPKETRSLLLHALKLSVLKEEYRPAKKHGLPPF